MGSGTADKHHGQLSFTSFFYLGLHLFYFRHFLCNEVFHLFNQFWFVKILGDLSQGFGGCPGTDEIDLDPGDTVFDFQHVRHIVDGSVAHDGIQIGCMTIGKLVIAGITAEGGNKRDTAGLQNSINLESIPTDVVFTQKIDLVLCIHDGVIFAHNMGEDAVIGYVVPCRLAHPFIAFAGKTKNIDTQLFLHFPGHGMDIISDETYRTG